MEQSNIIMLKSYIYLTCIAILCIIASKKYKLENVNKADDFSVNRLFAEQ